MKNDRINRDKIYYKGPNLILFSVALLLSIFTAYSVGVLVTKRAEEKRNASSKNIEISNKEEKVYKSLVNGKSYSNSKNSIIYFYNDNTYYLKNDKLGEYGTYEVNNYEVILYNLFTIREDLSYFTTLSGQQNIQIDNNYLIFNNKDSEGNIYEDKYELERSDINGGMADILLKIQNLIEK